LSLSAILDFLRRPYSVEHDLGIGRLSHGLCHLVAVIALVWVVAAQFFQQRNDLRRFLLAQMASSSMICSRRVAISSSWRWVIRIIAERAAVETAVANSGNGNGSSAARPNSGRT